jgi:hypothetical protein
MTWIDRLSPSERRSLTDSGRLHSDGRPKHERAYQPAPRCACCRKRLRLIRVVREMSAVTRRLLHERRVAR